MGKKCAEEEEDGVALLVCVCVCLTHPDVTLAGEEPLRDAGGVQASSSNVERGHEQQPAHLAHGGGLNQSLADDEVQGRNHAAQAQTHKHT